MRRGWKILLAIVLAIVALLAINMVIVNNQTKDAEVTVDGGQLISLPGGDVQVTDSGEPAGEEAGAPIVLVHCFGCSLHWWDAMVPLLSEEHRVIRIDLLGHGGSSKPKSGYAIEDQAGLVAGALGRLGVQGAVVVGHSLGASVAVSLAEQASELVDRVAIVNAAPDSSYGDLDFIAKLTSTPVIGQAIWRIKIGSLVKNGYEQAFAPGYDIDAGFTDPDQVVDDNKAMTYTSFTDSMDAVDDFTDEIALDQRMRATPVPLMAIFGAEDQINDAGPSLAAYAAVAGARTAEIADAGHSPNVETPEETARLLLEFAADAGDDSIEAPPRDVGQDKPDKPRDKRRRNQGAGSGGSAGPSGGSGGSSGGVSAG